VRGNSFAAACEPMGHSRSGAPALLLSEVQHPAAKSYYAGTHRLIPPGETVKRILRLARVMGITRVANVTGLDSIGVPVVMVCRPNSRSIAVSQGKGLTLAAAKASGLMEAVEGYHAERITLPLKLASYEELRYTHNVAEVSLLPQPENGLFDPNAPLLFIEGYDLLQNEGVWLPYELVHLNYTLPLPPGTGCFVASSNGLASGNHVLEAISHGICEVVERDATNLWHLKGEAGLEESPINLESVDDSDCRAVLEKFRRAEVEVAVWETTSDIGIPAFACLITDRVASRLRPLPPAAGFGCHPSRCIALLRALTEAAQARLTYISGSRDDLGRDAYEHSLSPGAARQDRALVEARGAMRKFRDGPNFESKTLNEDVGWELARLRSAGVERVIFVDLIKQEFGVPVVRMVIPGLEPDDSAGGHLPGFRARAVLENRA
jgi:YcaO-like protein with predicted kinase domain